MKRARNSILQKAHEISPALNGVTTVQEEAKFADWILGEECKRPMRHLPSIYSAMRKVATEFLKENAKSDPYDITGNASTWV